MSNGTGKTYSKVLQSNVERFSPHFRVRNAEEMVLSPLSGEKFGLENCNITEPVIYLAPKFSWFHSLVQVTSGLTCVTERRVCLCVHVCLSFLRIWHKSDNCLY